jgi:hypothetical protein
VAHKYKAASNSSVFVFLNPCAALISRINSASSDISELDVHRLILAAVTERWSLYLAYLEGLCGDIVSDAKTSLN